MKIISIAYRRTDILTLQRAAWERYVPGVPFLSAAHFDHKLEFEPDIEVNYHSDSRFRNWPYNYLIAVQQLLQEIDDDLIIVEGDIFPIGAVDLEEMFNPGTVRIYSGDPYPGLLFMPRGRLPFEDLTGVHWEYITTENNPLPFTVTDAMRLELIGDQFLHWNHGDAGYKNNPHMDPKRDIINDFNDWFDVGEWEQNDVDFPPITEQTMNLVQAMFKLGAAVTAGQPVKISKKEYEQRKRICTSCKFQAQHRCRKCGCYCSAKAALSTETCPEKKWP
jgi:hypothetical protein